MDISVKTIYAGKFRRYHGVSFIKQLLDIPTVLRNIRDVFLIGVGFLQSLAILKRYKPEVVFTKGGFVCLPVGLAAARLKIPIVVHDSDAHPGLTNRFLAKWATFVATGSPTENYNYDKHKTTYVGIPIMSHFKPATASKKQQMKKQLMVDPKRTALLVTGGGLGAQVINEAVLTIAPDLLKRNIEVFHVTGAQHGKDIEKKVTALLKPEERSLYHVEPFVDSDKMADMLKMADIVITRGGATALTELSAAAKAIILIPNPKLTAGHQLKNAKAFEDMSAAVVINEEKMIREPAYLCKEIMKVADDEQLRKNLEKRMLSFAKPDAAADVAALLVKATK